jgi:hypothetical protein
MLVVAMVQMRRAGVGPRPGDLAGALLALAALAALAVTIRRG